MQAICVSAQRELEVRDIPTPTMAAPGHVLVRMSAAAINHGDKIFLKLPAATGLSLGERQHDVWGASGAGRVLAIGAGVPADYADKQVAIYRSLGRTPDTVGLWCETAQVPYTSCLILPDQVPAKDYSGSLVNAITAYAFLEEIEAAGHQGVIVTAGNSATGYALAALAQQRGLAAIFLVRSESARQAMLEHGVKHVLVTDANCTSKLTVLAAELNATAVFDGVGGDLTGVVALALPLNSTIYLYGFLSGDTLLSIPGAALMMKNLTIRRFSNFESATVKQPDRLIAALRALERCIGDSRFITKIGQAFRYDQIEAAMAYTASGGGKAVLVGE